MPSALHEAIAEMLRAKPELIVTLMTAAKAPLPPHATAHPVPESLAPLVPDYRADRLFEIRDADRNLTRVAVVEVQLRPNRSKAFVLPLYQAVARARHRVPCDVVVLTPSARVARELLRPIELGGGSIFRALVIGPETLRPELIPVAPELAFLCALAHAERRPEIVFDALDRFDGLPVPSATLYFDLLLAALSDGTRQIVEALMETKRYEYKSAFARRYFEQGVDEGKARGREVGREEGREVGREEGREVGREEGLRMAIRSVLEARGVVLDGAHRERLDDCTDSGLLSEWARRAATASKPSDVFDPH